MRGEGSYSNLVVSFLLSVTFACGVVVAVAHVLNRRFIAPVYDVIANLTAFVSAVVASSLLGHVVPATFSAIAVVCWLWLARRTTLALRHWRGTGRPTGQQREAVPHRHAARSGAQRL